MRRVPIRTKLAGALLLPLLVLLVVTAAEVTRLSAQVDDVTEQAELARSALGPGGLINTLQDERGWAAVDLIGSQDLGINTTVEGYDVTREATEAAISDLREEIEARGGSVAQAFAPSMDALGSLDQLRAEIDANRASSSVVGTIGNNDFAETVFVRYTELIRPFFDAADLVIQSIEDPRLRKGASLANSTSHNMDLFSDIARHNIPMVAGGSQSGYGAWEPSVEHDKLVAGMVHWHRNNFEIAHAGAPYDAVIARDFPQEFVESFSVLTERVIAGHEVIPLDEVMDPLTTEGYGGLRSFRVALSDEVNATADRIVAEAQRREQVFVLTAIASLALAVALCWLVSRSITVPLRSLTRQATSMAHERLPAAVVEVLDTPLGEDVRVPSVAPVRVATRDEVGEVADALNVVQDTALRLAVEQAVLRRNIADSYLNLGRRNQHLLTRQLDFITGLEKVETDPDALGNLYRLDHLATRMRRNAESLLVLAGIEPPRQWATPVSVVAVVRAALGEVEDYQRVIVRDVEPATIVGAAAADLAHLLAELIENALTFSDAHLHVDVKGRRQAGGYVLAVIDTGAGMDPSSLEVDNRRLAGAESFTVAPSKYLGHYVAGNLAARHGIAVTLLSTPGRRGTTATVALPRELLVATGQAPSGDARSRHAGAELWTTVGADTRVGLG